MSSEARRPKSEKLARLFYELCALLGAAQIAAAALSAAHLLTITGTVETAFRLIVFRFGIVAPVGVFAVVVLVLGLRGTSRSAVFESLQSFAASPWVVRGLCISAALAFLSTEIGKLFHQEEMRTFFIESGYAVWFLYFVIVFETICSIGLLVPPVRLVAAIGGSVMMVGAIVTHARNGDPFSDSYEAAHLLLILLCIVALGVLQSRESLSSPGAQRRGIPDSKTRGTS